MCFCLLSSSAAATAVFKARGPGNVSGRTRAIMVDAADPTGNTYLAASIGGGIWRGYYNPTTFIMEWENLSPDIQNLDFVSLAQSSANPNVIYAGTGEKSLSGDDNGDGIYKSDDGGSSWSNITPLGDDGRIDPAYANVYRIIVDPSDENTLIIAAENKYWCNSYIYKSTDGGANFNEVLDAAGTKWNFNAYEPGLVGGHCIGVDPYYLTSKALKIGMQPKIILSGRDTNNEYPTFLAEQCNAWLKQRGITNPKILQFGLTFKENVPDIRNSQAFNLANILHTIDLDLAVIDPVADIAHIKPDFRLNPNIDCERFDAIVLAVPHRQFIKGGWQFINTLMHTDRSTLVMDIKAKLDRQSTPQAVDLWRP